MGQLDSQLPQEIQSSEITYAIIPLSFRIPRFVATVSEENVISLLLKFSNKEIITYIRIIARRSFRFRFKRS